MENGYFYVDLDHVKRGQPWRSKDGRTGNSGHARAHSNYILRESARRDLITVNVAANKHVIKSTLTAYDLIVKERSETEDVQLWGIPDGYQKHHLPRGYKQYGVAPKKGLIEYLPEGLRKPMRKDARLFYKVQHAFPVEMSKEAMREATKRFAWSMSGHGKNIVVASLHDLDTHNPHCHVLVIDKHIETGKSVLLLSGNESERRKKGLEPNSTTWVRKLWEIDCDGVLAEHGLDIRIDHRSNLERGLEAAREKHRGWQQTLTQELSENLDGTGELKEMPELVAQNEPLSTDNAVDVSDGATNAADVPVDDNPQSTDVPLAPEAQEMPTSDENSSDEEDLPLSTTIKNAAALQVELRHLNGVRRDLAALERAYEIAERQCADASLRLARATTQSVTARTERHNAESHAMALSRTDGRPLGLHVDFTIPVLKWRVNFKDPLRKISERALVNREKARNFEVASLEQAKSAAKDAVELALHGEVTLIKLNEHKAALAAKYQRTRDVYGSNEILDEAEAVMQDNINKAKEHFTSEDVYNAHEDGQITSEEATEAAELVGDHELAQVIRNEIKSGIRIS